jgi:hypothetical protein
MTGGWISAMLSQWGELNDVLDASSARRPKY